MVMIFEKFAHHYLLTVKWSNAPDWTVNILAFNIEVCNIWLPKNEDPLNYILEVSIKLIERNKEIINKESFLGRGIDGEK